MAEARTSVLPAKAPFQKRVRSSIGLWGLQFNVGRRWSRIETNPPLARPLLPVFLFAVIGTWCERDIIGATVRNAFAQGCQRVFIVDNDSPDDTREQAAAAGAEIAQVYCTDHYDERRRLAEMSRVVAEVSAGTAEHVWWLLSDADEFVHGPAGLTIADYLARLDRRFRVVGARVFNHFPTGEPANVLDRHPLDLQPLCEELPMAWCRLRHWKHPLFRWDRSGAPIGIDPGFHRLRAPVTLAEPRQGLFLHHFQYRNQADTSGRLRRLCEMQDDGVVRSARQDAIIRGGSGGRVRWAMLDHVYAQDWARVDRLTPRAHRPGVNPRPWTSLVSPPDAKVPRWYATDLADSAR
jgi:Glycosyl transferase family 2